MRRQPWKQAPLKAELLPAEPTSARPCVRRCRSDPQRPRKRAPAKSPPPPTVFYGPAWLADKATGLHARRRFEGRRPRLLVRAPEVDLLEPLATPTVDSIAERVAPTRAAGRRSPSSTCRPIAGPSRTGGARCSRWQEVRRGRARRMITLPVPHVDSALGGPGISTPGGRDHSPPRAGFRAARCAVARYASE